MDKDTLARRRRTLGDDHPDTLRSVNSLAWDPYHLGDPQAARGLNQDTLVRRRRILGDDHHDTPCSANSLAVDLIALSDLHAARMLTQDTLTRRRRVLGDDHPDTRYLAADLGILGDHQAAQGRHPYLLNLKAALFGESSPHSGLSQRLCVGTAQARRLSQSPEP